ncbi:MAG: hypothetical protein FJ276_24985 [Planctomycetes bacterium]|nr:hypothetical protein [Planctomycetota bacterium]
MNRCAYLTMDNLEGFFAYDHVTHEPLAELGWQVDEIPWRTPNVCWDDYRLVVIRSPWDYQADVRAFLDVLGQIDRSSARLENCLDVVRWNIEKTYLRDLAERGVAIVPTRWLQGLDERTLTGLFEEFGTAEVVLKPLVGANADDTFRVAANAGRDEKERVLRTFQERGLLAQPFVPSIVTVGEYSLFYFVGGYSHCVLKTPTSGDFRVQEEHGGSIRAVIPDSNLLAAGQCAIQAVDRTLLYARVDLAVLNDGQPAVMEVELIEPSLYFNYDQGAARRFATAVDQLMTGERRT